MRSLFYQETFPLLLSAPIQQCAKSDIITRGGLRLIKNGVIHFLYRLQLNHYLHIPKKFLRGRVNFHSNPAMRKPGIVRSPLKLTSALDVCPYVTKN